MHVGLPRQVSAQKLAHERPQSLQLAITLPGWIRSSVTSGHMPLDLDGCYVSRGKTTPTLHFLCLHGSHAIDAVSVPSSLMLSPNFEPPRGSDAPVFRLNTKMDGEDLPAMPEVRGARESRLCYTPKNPYPAGVLQLSQTFYVWRYQSDHTQRPHNFYNVFENM